MSKENCNDYLRKNNQGHPRTCKECGLNGCKYQNFDQPVMNKLKPISTAPRDRFILLAGDSGYSTTKLRFESGRWNASKERWDNHANDAFTDGGAEPEWWTDIPEVDIEKKSFNEWLATKEFKGIKLIDAIKGWDCALITKKQFLEKLLAMRIEISGDKLKGLLKYGH